MATQSMNSCYKYIFTGSRLLAFLEAVESTDEGEVCVKSPRRQVRQEYGAGFSLEVLRTKRQTTLRIIMIFDRDCCGT